MIELMGSTANEEFERRIAASWYGSRVAGRKVAVGTTTVSLVDVTSLALEASLVSLDTKWNVMVPRMKITMTHRKRETNGMLVTAVLASMASMASMVASMAPLAMASVASMVWVTVLKLRELRNEMLRHSPLKFWLCSSTKQAWEADGSRSSRRVDDVKVKKALTGSQIWAMVVTMAWMASMSSTNGGNDWWHRWVATNGGVDGWRRWVASMVYWGLRHRGH